MDMKTVKLGFIGYGNMSGATSRGLVRSGAVAPAQIYACAKDFEKLSKKAAAEGINAVKTAQEVVENSDVVFIGVKPWLVKEVMTPVKDMLGDKVVISLAAGLFDKDLEEIMPGSKHVATAPNTPVSVCEGIFLLESDNTLTEEQQSFTDELLKNISLVSWMDRAHMEVAGHVTGCSPAFVAMFMEALGDAACKYGITRPVAYSLIAQMMAGTGKMALESGDHPGQMKDAVCSPGGITIVGVTALEKSGFRNAVIDAIDQIEMKVGKKYPY